MVVDKVKDETSKKKSSSCNKYAAIDNGNNKKNLF